MEAKIERKNSKNKEKYEQQTLDLAYKFASDIYKEAGEYIKGIVLFGSSARKESFVGDIDILVVLDDVSVVMTPEFMEAYKVISRNLIIKHSRKLHITTLKYTSFWEYVISSDPVAINILRDGVAILDTGFFEPLQILLYKGRIRPTPEAIASYYTRAPVTLRNSKWHLMQATVDLYWACIDSGHAALMTAGEVPPSPEHVADLLEEKLVNTKLIEKKYSSIMRNFYKLAKMVMHNEISEITGEEYDRYYKEANDFVNRMKHFIENSKGPIYKKKTK